MKKRKRRSTCILCANFCGRENRRRIYRCVWKKKHGTVAQTSVSLVPGGEEVGREGRERTEPFVS